MFKIIFAASIVLYSGLATAQQIIGPIDGNTGSIDTPLPYGIENLLKPSQSHDGNLNIENVAAIQATGSEDQLHLIVGVKYSNSCFASLVSGYSKRYLYESQDENAFEVIELYEDENYGMVCATVYMPVVQFFKLATISADQTDTMQVVTLNGQSFTVRFDNK